MTLRNNRAPALTYFKLCASFGSHLWIQTRVMVRKCPNWGKICFELCDLDLWPLTLYFCMDIMSVNCYNSRKFGDDTMRGTLSTRATVMPRNLSADRSENGPTGSDLDQWNIPSKHDINGPFVVSVKATNGRNGSMASHFLSQMARFSVAICLPFKACHEPAVNGPLKASHFTAI